MDTKDQVIDDDLEARYGDIIATKELPVDPSYLSEALGTPLPECEGIPGGFAFNMNDNHATILLTSKEITDKFMNFFSRAPIKFFWHRDGSVFFMLLKLGDSPWFYCPFTPRASSIHFSAPVASASQGLECEIILGDSSAGMVRALRNIEVNPRTSCAFLASVREDLADSRPFNMEAFHYTLRETERRFPTGDMLAAHVFSKYARIERIIAHENSNE